MLTVEFEPCFSAWRQQARQLLIDGHKPESIWWQPCISGDANSSDTAINPSNAAFDRADPVENGLNQALKIQQSTLDFGDAVVSGCRSDQSRSNGSRSHRFQSHHTHLAHNADVFEPTIQPRVSKTFMSLAERVACHRQADRWAVLYEILWRLNHGETNLLQLASDPTVKILQKMAKAINRDVHKMKAFVRFKTVDEAGHHEPRYVAWFEPEHAILPLVASFFVKRFSNMRWSILTPDGCLHWECGISGGDDKHDKDDKSGDKLMGQQPILWFSQAVGKSAAPSDDVFDKAWTVYYRSIFNPARLKIQAMQSEMPQKYWKNLPEASVIGELVQSAMQTTGQMLSAEANPVILQCGPRPVTNKPPS